MAIKTDFDVICIGAGISGINAGYRLQTQCPDKTYTILEARGAMGGTWDLFKYPGIRSDSDLHTFGFPWYPWNEQKAIADGPSIVKYINETASKFGIDKKIKYHTKVLSVNFSSDQQKWIIQTESNGKATQYYANFIIFSTGYYDYENPLATTIPGLDSFKGTIVHPQFWPEDLDYTDKEMVVVGSGATAITLLPVLGEKARHVTMLQRSPGYILNRPMIDPTGKWTSKYLPTWAHHWLIRWKFLVLPFIFFNFCRAFPNAARKVIRLATVRELPKNVPHDPHFNPSYNPWEQRMCVAPDGDFYKSLRDGKCEVATGAIKSVSADGITLESGQKLPADIIITATGLKIQVAGGATVSVDGEQIKPGDKFFWKGVMLQDLPNAAFVLGYTNASWTLGADATAQTVCRLLNNMKKEKATAIVPRVEDGEKMQSLPVLNLNSTYVKKAAGTLPKAGDRGPWKARSNYFSDIFNAKFGDVKTGLQFYRVST